MLFRVLQGVGGGMILPIGQLMMAEAAGPKRMGRVMSLVAVPAMLAPILGPTIGGLIIDDVHCRASRAGTGCSSSTCRSA